MREVFTLTVNDGHCGAIDVTQHSDGRARESSSVRVGEGVEANRLDRLGKH